MMFVPMTFIWLVKTTFVLACTIYPLVTAEYRIFLLYLFFLSIILIGIPSQKGCNVFCLFCLINPNQ
jgi:hypothetical protein